MGGMHGEGGKGHVWQTGAWMAKGEHVWWGHGGGMCGGGMHGRWAYVAGWGHVW